MLRVSFRRNWYPPPFDDRGEVDYEIAIRELADELTGGTLVVARYLQNGDLGYATEIPVASKDELEHLLQTIRELFVEGLKHDNAIRAAGVEAFKAKIAECQTRTKLERDRRQDHERRTHQRCGRQLLGRLFFRKDDRRVEEDRRSGIERRAA